MSLNIEIKGIEDGTTVDIEVCNGVIKVMTDTPRTCCVAIVKLDKQRVLSLIDALNSALEELTPIRGM